MKSDTAKKATMEKMNYTASFDDLVRWANERERKCLRIWIGKGWWRNVSAQPLAHAIVHRALLDGVIEKKPCEICGCKIVQAHHDNYNRPLDIHWLCLPHHKQHHVSIFTARNEDVKAVFGEGFKQLYNDGGIPKDYARGLSSLTDDLDDNEPVYRQTVGVRA